MLYVCTVKCFYDGRLYDEGEAVEFDSAADLPPYFEPLKMKQETEGEPDVIPAEDAKGTPVEEKPKRGRRKKNG